MTDTVIVAIIAAVGTLISGVISSIISASVSNNVQKYRLEQLEKKVDKHNNLIERTYANEKEIDVLKNEIQNLKEDVK